MKLSIIIPAYNEEQSIASTIEKTLAARADIIRNAKVDSVEVVVVDDGSRDNTKRIAEGYKDILLVSDGKNRGCGGAIKKGFEHAGGDLLSFLDADGTCNPMLFIDLVNALIKDNADISIGSRLGPGSKMPAIRRLGNTIYAKLINFLGNAKITDSASGMRVLKRKALDKLYPLPDGMHFTPAMTCKAIMGKDLKIVEVPIEYAEREGKSKLNVIRDGQQFLKTILEIAFFYKPLKFFMSMSVLLFVAAALYSLMPIGHYIANHRIEESFIYRLITISVLIVAGGNFAILGLLAEQLTALLNNRPVKNVINPGHCIMVGSGLVIFGVLINVKPMMEYASTGSIQSHWIYVLVGAIFVLLGIEILGCGFLQKLIVMYRIEKTARSNEA